jgi:hypothetical protein
MAMKFLSFHNQFIAGFPPDDQNDDLIAFDIIQGTRVSDSQLKLRQGIGAQALDRFRRRRGLLLQTGQDGCLKNTWSRADNARNCRSASSVMVILIAIPCLMIFPWYSPTFRQRIAA